MNMQANNNHNLDQPEFDKVIDASLAAYPLEPLSSNFTANVMQAIAVDANAVDAISVVNSTDSLHDEAVAPIPWVLALFRSGIRSGLREGGRQLGLFISREAASVLSQIRRGDIMVAACFALLWCVVAASFIWTSRLVTTQTNALGEIGQVAWLIPLCTLIGGVIALCMLGAYVYFEQRDS